MTPEEQSIRSRIAEAERDRAEASAQLLQLAVGTKLMGGIGWGILNPDVDVLKGKEADAIARRTAAITELAEYERR